jgi:hypothetical protein
MVSLPLGNDVISGHMECEFLITDRIFSSDLKQNIPRAVVRDGERLKRLTSAL